MEPVFLVRPWKRTAEVTGEGPVVIVATRLRLARLRHIPRFLRWSTVVRRQVLRSDGALGVGLYALPWKRTYCTLSAWRDEPSIRRFMQSSPHLEIMAHFSAVSGGDGIFRRWTADPGSLPPKWSEATARLDSPHPASASPG
jgi:hypothetical protein